VKVLITGSRDWIDKDTIRGALRLVEHRWFGERLTVIHGGAPGADTLAGEVADEMGANVYRFPAEWRRYGRAAGAIRNAEMLDTMKPDLVLAFPLPSSRGTWHCVKAAWARGVPVKLIA
jgi:nucleoside-diphosphate-sugar epimerase